MSSCLNDTTAEELITRQTPLVMTNGPSEQWIARQKWDPTYLRQRVKKQIKMVYKHRVPRFGPLYRPTKPLGVLQNVKWENPHEYVNMTSDAFFDYISKPVGRAPVIKPAPVTIPEGGVRKRKKPEEIAREQAEAKKAVEEAAYDAAHPDAVDYLYYTGDLDRSLITDLLPIVCYSLSGITSRDPPYDLLDSYSQDDLILTTNRSTINIWIGQAGVLAHTHMDSYNNFFVQIHGNPFLPSFHDHQSLIGITLVIFMISMNE
jgi:hypothetical protein